MIKNDIQRLGDKITGLRLAKNLKQSELAYEAGISERTLQRMEAGEVVKSDGLLKVIAYLGKLDDMLSAIDTPKLSPYQLASRPTKGSISMGRSLDEGTLPRARVRASKKTAHNTHGKINWPEDQT